MWIYAYSSIQKERYRKENRKFKICNKCFSLAAKNVFAKCLRNENHWWNEQRTRRKHRVSSEWINNRMALVRSKYCQNTLSLPFDPLRLIFLSHRGSFVLINIVSLHVSQNTGSSNTRIRSHERNRGCFAISRVLIIINGLYMKHLKTSTNLLLSLGNKKWTIVT